MSIIIKDMSFSYQEKQVLNHINLSVETGEAVGMIGSSGGGKSTLLKIISGLYERQTGEIFVMGVHSSNLRRKNVSMVMQNPSLFPASIHDNITCGHSMEEAHIMQACEAAQLTEWITGLPDGLNTFVGQRGSKVSGGQAQRIAIARAIAKNAPVVLLDEPTSALDHSTSSAVMKALAELAKGRTVLHISHKPETLTGCSRIVRLEEGCLYDSCTSNT